MRTINIGLKRKEPAVGKSQCVIERMVELSNQDFRAFKENLLADYDFIRENSDRMYQDGNGIYHCLLVLGEGYDDGVLVESEGADYARYSSPLPNARQIWQRELHPSLAEFSDRMVQLTEKYALKAVECQQDCQYRISREDLNRAVDHDRFSEELFWEMLSERPEFEYVEPIDDEAYVTIAPEYVRQEDNSHLRELTQEDIDVMCARHILWLHDAGGEQADFSGCYIKGLDLSRRNLNSAVFDNAKLVNVDLRHAELCFASCSGTIFRNCEATDMTAEEAVFKGADFLASEFDRGIFIHSNFGGAKFRDCSVVSSLMQNCCFDKTDFGDMPMSSVKTDGCSYDEQEWTDEQSCSELTM